MKTHKVKRILCMLLAMTMMLGLTSLALCQESSAEAETGGYGQKAITVCVSMEKFTLGQGYILEPTLIKVEGQTRASEVITKLLKEKYPDMLQSWKMTGSVDEAFYLSSVYDPDHGAPVVPGYISDKVFIDLAGGTEDWLGEFDYCWTSGWMYSVNGKFPNVGASDWRLSDGEVMRWQFTLYGYGSDLGADNTEWGAENITDVGNKDALTWAVAVCNSIDDKALLASSEGYANALAVLQDMEAGQEKVDAALAALKQDIPVLDIAKKEQIKEEKL